MNLNISLVLTLEKKPPLALQALLYLPVLALMAPISASPGLFFRYAEHMGRWKFEPAYDSPWFYITMCFILAYSAAFIALLAFRRNKTGLNRERRQMDVILGAFISTTVLVNLTQFIIPTFKLYRIPDIGPSGHALYLVGLYYAVFRLGFMSEKQLINTDELIGHISEMVVLTDRENRIVLMNGPAKNVISGGITANAPCFFNVIDGNATIRELFNELSAGPAHTATLRISYKKGADRVHTDSYVSRITDRFSDHAGFLVISSENRGRKTMQEAYRITDREFEVIELSVAGRTNLEIARALTIAERTVETHLVNIYNKLKVGNKIELMNMAIRFGLVAGSQKKDTAVDPHQ
ncbi:MAG: response regulator transcription factor [Spirochaetes bacterium]|nr:response regulator transcription factor [Spirochaetota bacterium]